MLNTNAADASSRDPSTAEVEYAEDVEEIEHEFIAGVPTDHVQGLCGHRRSSRENTDLLDRLWTRAPSEEDIMGWL